MKIQIFSDLHLEFGEFVPSQANPDVVILAGDIHIKHHGFVWAQETFAPTPVLYVLGNHEYYGKSYPKHLNDLKQQAKNTNVHILENDAFVVNDICFLGCTLWTNYELFGDPRIAGYEATQVMTDYKRIRVSPSFRKLKSLDTAVIHARSIHWLRESIEHYKDMKTVIITHHAPSIKSIKEREREDIVSAAYASNLDEFVESSNALLWVHGHIHTQRDYMIGNTRVICNPRGYLQKPNPEFIQDFCVYL